VDKLIASIDLRAFNSHVIAMKIVALSAKELSSCFTVSREPRY
jgi:hypothetical protein